MSNPFQLVSCGEDGLARMWDIREAALKRYGDHYSSSVIMDDATDRDNTDAYHSTQSVQPNSFNASSQEGRREAAEEVSGISNNGIPGIEFGRNFGDFVANDHIDAGVTLIAQLHHGDNIEDKGSPGPVTRTGHGKQVKVMCIARSPVGGHFATGSNDGMGRVWADDDNWQVGSLDDLRQCGPDDDVTRHSSKMMLKSRMGASPLYTYIH
jgi:WD40 repeat protein